MGCISSKDEERENHGFDQVYREKQQVDTPPHPPQRRTQEFLKKEGDINTLFQFKHLGRGVGSPLNSRKWTICVISSDPLCKDCNARFTTVPLKP